MSTNDNDIGNLIKQKRKEKGLTLEQVGNRVGVGKSTVSKWERGYIKNMGRDKVELLSSILDIDPLIFVYGTDYITNENISIEIKKDNKPITHEEFMKDMKNLIDQYLQVSEEEKKEIVNYLEYICQKINQDKE